MLSNNILPENFLLQNKYHKYRLIRTIGQGAMARTYLAEDESQQNRPRCVVKQFFPIVQASNNNQAKELFRQEAERLRELGNHPQIPTLWDYYELDEQQYLVQEFVDGQNLEAELAESGAVASATTSTLGSPEGSPLWEHC